MFRSLLVRPASRSVGKASRSNTSSPFARPTLSVVDRSLCRGYATEAEDHDVVIIGGGVAGYVAAIKAGQEGLKVCRAFICY